MTEHRGDEMRLDTRLPEPRRARAAQVVRRDGRDAGSLASLLQIAPYVAPRPKEPPARPRRVAERVLYQVDSGAHDGHRTSSALGLRAAQERAASREVDVDELGRVRLAPARARRQDERDTRRAIGRELGEESLGLGPAQEALARLVVGRESFGQDRAQFVPVLAATLRDLERATKRRELFLNRGARRALRKALVDEGVDGPSIDRGERSFRAEDAEEVTRLRLVASERAARAALQLPIAQEVLERFAQRGFVRGSVGRIGSTSFELTQLSFGGLLVAALGAPLDSLALEIEDPAVPDRATLEESVRQGTCSFRRRYASNDARGTRSTRPPR